MRNNILMGISVAMMVFGATGLFWPVFQAPVKPAEEAAPADMAISGYLCDTAEAAMRFGVSKTDKCAYVVAQPTMLLDVVENADGAMALYFLVYDIFNDEGEIDVIEQYAPPGQLRMRKTPPFVFNYSDL